MFSDRDYFWMEHAYQLGISAAERGEVPVGAVLVCDDAIIGEGSNSPIERCDPTAHAEIIALREGAKTIGNYRLINSTLYVTLEPCIMCIGAITHARVQRLVYGALDAKAGAVKSQFQVLEAKVLNHKVDCAGGLLADKCGMMLSDFFRKRRLEKKKGSS